MNADPTGAGSSEAEAGRASYDKDEFESALTLDRAFDRRFDLDFERTVLPRELELLGLRDSAHTRPLDSDGIRAASGGLPDFSRSLADILPDEKRSSFFADTLQRLADDEQEALWAKWATDEGGHAGLTGLALSGGGIRSSTIALGVVQYLHGCGLFKCFDYLSTVSGGGYLGASLSAHYAGAPKADDSAPPSSDRAEQDKGAQDKGDAELADQERLRRIQSDFPYTHEPGKPESFAFQQLRDYSKFLVPRGFVDYLKLPTLVARGILVNLLMLLPWIMLAALISALLMTGTPLEARWVWVGVEEREGVGAFRFTVGFVAAFLLLAVLFPILRRFVLVAERAAWRARFETFTTSLFGALVVVAFIEVQPLVLSLFADRGDLYRWAPGAVGALAAALSGFGRILAKRLTSFVGRWGLYLIALAGALALWGLYLVMAEWLLLWAPFGYLSFSLVIAALSAYTLYFADANGLSMHNFYEDRIGEAFLFRVDSAYEGPRSLRLLRLSELSDESGPYHLINTALNARNFPYGFQKGRKAEPFVLSRNYVGSRVTGYAETRVVEDFQPDFGLATAIAVSGAAVSSNMGTKTNAALRAILTVLNIRLGYWLANPLAIREGQLLMRARARYGVGVSGMFAELFGRLGYDKPHVYLSDGGHIENLGLYELIRRQCRFIVMSDGEADPSYAFRGLADALRLARIDFGVVIEMDGLDEIRSGEQQHARGTIYYGDGRIGYLIYLKSSLIGDDMIEATVSEGAYVTSPLRSDVRRYDELGYIANYKSRHPAFPQESTADQFFDEEQFECYRALGYLIAKRAFAAGA